MIELTACDQVLEFTGKIHSLTALNSVNIVLESPVTFGNSLVNIGHRLRSLRKEKGLSQGDIEERTGLRRCYTSRVENGHIVPSIQTLEKMARALEIPLYQIFYDFGGSLALKETSVGRPTKEGRFLDKMRQAMGRMNETDQRFLLSIAQKMASR